MAKIKGSGEAKPGQAGKALPVVEAVAKTESDRIVRVVAKKVGFYGNARRPVGSEFDIVLAPSQKLPSWVVEKSEHEEAQASAASSSNSQATAASDSSADVI